MSHLTGCKSTLPKGCKVEHYRGADWLRPRLQEPQKRWNPGKRPRVRIHLPPAMSQLRTMTADLPLCSDARAEQICFSECLCFFSCATVRKSNHEVGCVTIARYIRTKRSSGKGTGAPIDCSPNEGSNENVEWEGRNMFQHSTSIRLFCTAGLVGLLAAVPGARTGSAQNMNDMVRTLSKT